MNAPQQIYALLQNLIRDGEALVKTAKPHGPYKIVDGDKARKWANELILFTSMADDLVKPWLSKLHHAGKAQVLETVQEPLAALQTIKYALDEGLLHRAQQSTVIKSVGRGSGKNPSGGI